MRRIGDDLVALRLRLEILGPGIQRHLHYLVFVGGLARDDDLALAMEERDTELAWRGPAVLGHQAADFRRGAVAVSVLTSTGWPPRAAVIS